MSKKIILCFDGTCNEPEDADQEQQWWRLGELEDDGVTNVFKLHLLFGGNLRDDNPGAFDDQLSFYYPGVGTYGGTLKRAFNAVFAPPNKDVGEIIREALSDLQTHFRAGDQVFLFGFSRGSAIARRFAAILPQKFDADTPTPGIRFMGLFDTVASIGVPNLNERDKPVSDVVFENHTISPAVDEALHLLSLDENRKAFMPTLMNRDERVTEIWFSGVHSDIGGGNRFDGLSDLTLQFLLDEIQRRDLGVQILSPLNMDYEGLAPSQSGVDIDLDDISIQPSHLGKMHRQLRPPITAKITQADRFVRVNVNDQASDDPPLIHHSVIDRVFDDPEYRPRSLRGKAHRIWVSDSEEESYTGLREHLVLGKRVSRALQPGESKELTVYANQKYNRSGVLLERGGEYYFQASGNQTWNDGGIDCGPAGWDRAGVSLGWKEILIRLQEDERRFPKAKWFEVIGSIGRSDASLIRVLDYQDASHTYKALQSGEFFTFANDLDRFYYNNMGFIRLTISRAS